MQSLYGEPFPLGQIWELYRASWGVRKESGMFMVTLKGTIGFERAGGFLGLCKTKIQHLTLQVQLKPEVSRAPSISPHSVIGSSILKYLRSRGLQCPHREAENLSSVQVIC